MLNVVCVQTGNYLGRGAEYVRRLQDGVFENLTLPYRFVCLSDVDIPGVECIPARFPGWWEKVRLFEPGLFYGRVLFLDLDTFLVGNINHIAGYSGHFATLHDFWNPKGLGPAVMLFDPEWAAHIYQEWKAEGYPMRDPRGDQGWIENRNQGRMRKDVDILQELHPGEFVSYKTHCTKGIPEGARVVCFHGKPRPHEAKGWVEEHWNMRVAYG
jgi:hypothetical protein